MIAGLIRWSVANRILVLLAALFIAAAGTWSVLTTPLDAIPDPSGALLLLASTGDSFLLSKGSRP